MTPQQIHEHLEQLRRNQAPLPLTDGQAVAQALRLRLRHGMTYREISRVMNVYHGVFLGGEAWRKRCRSAGAPPSKPGWTRAGDRLS